MLEAEVKELKKENRKHKRDGEKSKSELGELKAKIAYLEGLNKNDRKGYH